MSEGKSPEHAALLLLQLCLNYVRLTLMAHATVQDLEIDSLQSLAQAQVGCDFQIRALEGPGCEQLRNLGFCETLKVRKLAGGRNLICSLCGTRLAVSSVLAEQVLVSAVTL